MDIFCLLYIYIYILKTYSYIIMVINSKLVIDYNILKIILAQNWLNHILYTTLNYTALWMWLQN